MNIEEKVMMLKELRKQHKHFIKGLYNPPQGKSLSTDLEVDILNLIEEKIEQILKTI